MRGQLSVARIKPSRATLLLHKGLKMALTHAFRKAAYRRGDLFNKRRQLIAD